MAWKNEIRTYWFNVDAEHSNVFYCVAREYCKIGDITQTVRNDARVSFAVTTRAKNACRLWHDAEVMRKCGIDIKGGA